MSLISGNTFYATVWTDARRDYPMLPQVSPIQRCPECGKYYFLDQCKSQYDKDSWSWELGKLNYGDLKLAYRQLSKELLSYKQRWVLNHEFFMSYNDCFRRYPEKVAFPPSDKKKKMFLSIIRNLLHIYRRSMTHPWIRSRGLNKMLCTFSDHALFYSELLRESRQFDKAKAVLAKHKSPNNEWIVRKLVRLCDQQDDSPQLLIKNGEIAE